MSTLYPTRPDGTAWANEAAIKQKKLDQQNNAGLAKEAIGLYMKQNADQIKELSYVMKEAVLEYVGISPQLDLFD